MDTNTQQFVPPQVTPGMSSVPEHHDKKVGPIVATLIIVLVLIIAALYIFATKMNTAEEMPAMTDSLVKNPATVSSATNESTLNTSDDLTSLEEDLDVSVDGLDDQNF